MQTLVIANTKGGAGKSTTTVNLAAALGAAGRRVLVIDLDSQQTAARWLGVEAPGKGEDLAATLIGEGDGLESQAVAAPGVAGVSVVAGGTALDTAESAILADLSRLDAFADALEALDARSWDWVLTDTPPRVGPLLTVAILASRWRLLPVTPDPTSLEGLARTEAVCRRLARRGAAELLGILPWAVDRRTRVSVDLLRALAPKNPLPAVGIDVRLTESSAHGRPVLYYAPGSRAAVDFAAVAEEIEKRIRRKSS